MTAELDFSCVESTETKPLDRITMLVYSDIDLEIYVELDEPTSKFCSLQLVWNVSGDMDTLLSAMCHLKAPDIARGTLPKRYSEKLKSIVIGELTKSLELYTKLQRSLLSCREEIGAETLYTEKVSDTAGFINMARKSLGTTQ